MQLPYLSRSDGEMNVSVRPWNLEGILNAIKNRSEMASEEFVS